MCGCMKFESEIPFPSRDSGFGHVELSITTQAHAPAPAKSKMAAEGKLKQAVSPAPLFKAHPVSI